MADLTDEEIEIIATALSKYHAPRYHGITDYQKVVKNRKELTVDGNTIYEYPCPCQTIYLDETNYAVTYGRQFVIEDKYYYDFNPHDLNIEIAGTYEEVAPYEWKRTHWNGEDE